MSIESVMPSNHLLLCRPLLNLSQHQGLFKWVTSSHQVQSIGVSASVSVLPMNIQDWFPLVLTGWIFLQSKGPLRVFSNTTVQSINSLALSFLYGPTFTSIHDYGKNHSLDYTDHCRQRSLLFNMLSTFFIAFLPRSKCLNELILSLYADSLTRIPLYRRNCFSLVVFKFFSLTYDNWIIYCVIFFGLILLGDFGISWI